MKYVSTRIGVMYLGKLVETAASDELYAHPLHPYTQVLLSNALPGHPDDAREEVILSGEVPSAFNPPPRLPLPPALSARHAGLRRGRADARASEARGHLVACHLYGA